MAFIQCINTSIVEVRYTQYGNLLENTLYFVHPDGVTYNRLKSLCEGVAEWWHVELRPYQMNNLMFRETYGRDLTIEDGIDYTDTTYAGVYGSYVSGTPLPSGTTKAISFRTGFVGRAKRGRNYLVGLSTAMVTNNTLDSGIANDIVDAYNELIFPSAYLGANWVWVQLSRYFNKQPREFGEPRTVQTVLFASLNLDSQRMRLSGRGE